MDDPFEFMEVAEEPCAAAWGQLEKRLGHVPPAMLWLSRNPGQDTVSPSDTPGR